MHNLLTTNFWFNNQPGALLSSSSKIFIALIILFFALAAAAYFLKSRKGFYSRLWGKFGNFFVSHSLIGFVLWFFSTEQIPLLSARFWLLIWLVGAGVWLFFILRYSKTLPEKKRELQKEKEFQKYIP
jgi:hypothetical protein